MPEKFQTGLVLWLQFDEKRGNIAYDQSGLGNNGTIYGATFVNSPFLYALSFDGVDDYVVVRNSASLQVVGDLTIAFWMYPTNIAKGRQNPLDKNYAGEFSITLEPDGALSYWHGNGTTYFSGYKAYPPGSFVNSNWYFVAITRDISSSTVKFYKNGTLVASRTFTIYPVASTNDVYVGAGYAGYYQGTIDEVRIYNRALSDEEIKQLYYDYIKKHYI